MAQMSIVVKTLDSTEERFDVQASDTLDILKDKIQERLGHSPNLQSLVLGKAKLEDQGTTLGELLGSETTLLLLVTDAGEYRIKEYTTQFDENIEKFIFQVKKEKLIFIPVELKFPMITTITDEEQVVERVVEVPVPEFMEYFSEVPVFQPDEQPVYQTLPTLEIKDPHNINPRIIRVPCAQHLNVDTNVKFVKQVVVKYIDREVPKYHLVEERKVIDKRTTGGDVPISHPVKYIEKMVELPVVECVECIKEVPALIVLGPDVKMCDHVLVEVPELTVWTIGEGDVPALFRSS